MLYIPIANLNWKVPQSTFLATGLLETGVSLAIGASVCNRSALAHSTVKLSRVYRHSYMISMGTSHHSPAGDALILGRADNCKPNLDFLCVVFDSSVTLFGLCLNHIGFTGNWYTFITGPFYNLRTLGLNRSTLNRSNTVRLPLLFWSQSNNPAFAVKIEV
uniref:Uncharacterized protein n=1 Tax=Ditylenchus dipsaci TaxID=166011 RepID=A0A915D692_9BILA